MIGYRLASIPLLVFGVAALSAVVDFPFREVTTAAFLLVGPGAALTWLAGVQDRTAWLALVVPISLSIDLLVTTALLYLGISSAELSLAVITAMTVVVIALVPFERGARVALIAIALLPGLVLVAGELSPQPASSAFESELRS